MAPNLPQIRVSDIDLLNDWDLSNVKAFSDSIPGYRSGATFLTTLRSNLHLSATYPSPYSSLVSTPTTPAFSSTALLTHPNPSALSISTPIDEPISQTHYTPVAEPEPEPDPDPILTTITLTPIDTTSRSTALALIASSITEQRAASIKAVARHQVTIAFLVLLTATLYKYATPLTTISTLLILSLASLAILHHLTHPYADLASSITSSWLTPQLPTTPGSKFKSEDPLVLVSKYGDIVVGALVLRVVKRERKAYVRAWTVDRAYRGRGIGSSLLEQAVRVAWGRGARGVGFEEGIVHSHKVLPNAFNAVFEEREARARRLLAETVAEVKRERSSR